MPSGSFLTKEQKQQIYYLCVHTNLGDEETHGLLFSFDPKAISCGYLRRICTQLRVDVDLATNFLNKCGTRKGNAGRPCIFDRADEELLNEILKERQLRDLSRLLFLMMDRETDEIPSTCSVFQLLKRTGILER